MNWSMRHLIFNFCVPASLCFIKIFTFFAEHYSGFDFFGQNVGVFFFHRIAGILSQDLTTN